MADTVRLHILKGSKVARDVCELVERLYHQGRRVVVWVSDHQRGQVLDEYLWVFSQSSFVPHGLWQGTGPAEDPVVVMAGSLVDPGNGDVLVLAEAATDREGLQAFSEIHEVCASAREAERTHFWQEAGFCVQRIAASG